MLLFRQSFGRGQQPLQLALRSSRKLSVFALHSLSFAHPASAAQLATIQRSCFHTSHANLRRARDVEREDFHADTVETIKGSDDNYMLPHPLWQGEYVDGVKVTHENPQKLIDWLAMAVVKTIRFNFDWMSGYSWQRLNESIWLKRLVFLETVAGS
eukprot:c12844_g3_i2.p1 GENE.c12844_g3_i2~~c12844_g3_i2.p1  ORF type:complete len:156 (-),score=30.81 c12844_g3_i2:665-1132(-)